MLFQRLVGELVTRIATSSREQLSFRPSGREIDAELSYSIELGRGWLGAKLFARRQPGHVANAEPDLGAAIRYSLGYWRLRPTPGISMPTSRR